ncbi:hypothetical protein GLOTRDRAFT_111837 [Gloeophyllum trabeum ATCC 11539]|uniref:Uncharacterized protein n=1 Tax=Gloeophyllum trabeum (strain ATCC 11539 / FP-39264 / Madison 617) TaxID=670483 RepID=S7PZH3_GLOTA|nr:uncharacterized protein GLOTRDRAFT_111837 [Gloeophyllum trabeum ATCC 11539]EPQ53061.1 hypothetical protein GLOTRDRAFT_111837 [Gloeophyllum trabeum ATCC 11539]
MSARRVAVDERFKDSALRQRVFSPFRILISRMKPLTRRDPVWPLHYKEGCSSSDIDGRDVCGAE